ncbi:unnamed protein product [Arctogadus glacialis]
MLMRSRLHLKPLPPTQIWVGARPGPMLQRGRAETITLARGAEDGHYGALLSCTEQRPQRGGAARPQVNHSSDRVKRLADSSSNTRTEEHV